MTAATLRRIVTVVTVGILVAHTASAQVDPHLYAGLSWRNLGPFRAGRVSAVSGVIGDPGTFYAGFPGGGLWKTTSAGQVWYPVFDAVKEVSSVGAVEVAPSDPSVVYVGTGDMITGGTLDQGNGVYKSTDAGATWQHLGLAATRHIQTMLVDPRNPDIVLVGALGDHIRASADRGVYRSTDGGRTWVKTLHIDDSTGIAKLARAFDVPDVIFATSVRHWTPPGYAVGKYRSWQFGTAVRPSPDTGRSGTAIYQSRDGGVTWAELRGEGLPRLLGRTTLAVAMGTAAQRLYLITDGGLYRSDDGGQHWRRMAADDPRIRNGQGGYSAGVYVDPKNPDLIYTINTAAYRSTDGGATFTGMFGAPGGDDPQQLWIDPTNGKRILMGLDQGAIVSLDGGETWGDWYNQSTEQLYHLAVDNSWPYWIYAAQQDAGAIRTRNRGNYGAVSIFDWNPVGGWEWGTIIPDPRDPNTVFASGSGIQRISYPTEQIIDVSPALDPAVRVRTTPSMPLIWAPWNQRLLLAGFNSVYGTTDGGSRWTRMSPDLAKPAGMDSATGAKRLGGYGAIESMVASTLVPGEIWVGTDNGIIQMTRDTGRTWHDVSIRDLPNPRVANISSVELSHRTPGTAYVAVEYLRSGDHRPYLYRTRDRGRTWTAIVAGLPADEPSGSFARVLREDAQAPGLLFAGTESSIYVSFDDGDHWQSLALDLPNSPVRDLTIKGNDLLIATHGRGLWVIDDISMLRELRRRGSAVAADRVWLFGPGTATRVRRNVNQDTPLHREIPYADNPPDGAIIDYWLGGPVDSVTIDILDAAGSLVRRYPSTVPEPIAESAKPSFPNFWLAEPRGLPTAAGGHRANWDLRYDAPPAFARSYEINANPGATPASPEGPLVAPGTYTIRLRAGSETRTRTVTVRNDPRSPATAAAVRQQVTFQTQITAAMRSAWDGEQQVTALRSGIASAAAGSNDVRQALDALSAAIDSAAGGSRGSGRPSNPATGPTFRSTSGAFGGMLNAQDNADFAPTAGMRALYAARCADLAKAHAAWRHVLTVSAPAANAVLTSRGLAPLVVPRAAAAPVCR